MYKVALTVRGASQLKQWAEWFSSEDYKIRQKTILVALIANARGSASARKKLEEMTREPDLEFIFISQSVSLPSSAVEQVKDLRADVDGDNLSVDETVDLIVGFYRREPNEQKVRNLLRASVVEDTFKKAKDAIAVDLPANIKVTKAKCVNFGTEINSRFEGRSSSEIENIMESIENEENALDFSKGSNFVVVKVRPDIKRALSHALLHGFEQRLTQFIANLAIRD